MQSVLLAALYAALGVDEETVITTLERWVEAMKKPVGKYNVHNKVMRSEGTSP